MKNIQIPEELFIALVKYHLLDMDECKNEIQKGLEQKIDAIVRHQLYTAYKIAPTKEEREKARQDYLNKVGIHQDFRW